MDWKDQYCKNRYLSKSNLQIQFNPNQNKNIFHRNSKTNLNLVMSPKDLGGQATPSKKNNAEGVILPDF